LEQQDGHELEQQDGHALEQQDGGRGGAGLVLAAEDRERRAVADETERAERADQQRADDELVQPTRRRVVVVGR